MDVKQLERRAQWDAQKLEGRFPVLTAEMADKLGLSFLLSSNTERLLMSDSDKTSLKMICKVCEDVGTCRQCKTCGDKRVLVWPRFQDEVCPKGKWDGVKSYFTITTIHPARNETDEVQPTCLSMLGAGADEVIVYDDGSDTPLVQTPGTLHFRNEKTLGPSVCRNRGGLLAKGDVLVFADAHTRIDNLRGICEFSLAEHCVVTPSMQSLYGSGATTGYSRHFKLNGPSNELIGFDKCNVKPQGRYSYSYGNWGGFFIMPRIVFTQIDGWVDHRYWGYNDPSLYLKCFFCDIDVVVDRDTIYKHKGKVKCGFGYPVTALQPLLNLFHSYFVLFDKSTFENHWLPLLEKEHKWAYDKGIDHIQSESIQREEKVFKSKKKRDDKEFFESFVTSPKSGKHYISSCPSTAKMSSKHQSKILEILKPGFSVLEWGCGGSTLQFSPLVKLWCSIEHNLEWFFKIKKRASKSVQLSYTPLSDTKYLHPELIFGDVHFDVILIDGRKRVECALSLLPHISIDSIVLVHDFERKRYSPILNHYVCEEIVGDKTQLAVLRKKQND